MNIGWRSLIVIGAWSLCINAEENQQTGQIKIPVAQQGDASVARPQRGMLMVDVEKTFGVPQRVVGPIGQPPITRWFYDDYTVIFEHNHVVHTVLKMKVPSTLLPVDVPAETQSTAPTNDSAAPVYTTTVPTNVTTAPTNETRPSTPTTPVIKRTPGDLKPVQ